MNNPISKAPVELQNTSAKPADERRIALWDRRCQLVEKIVWMGQAGLWGAVNLLGQELESLEAELRSLQGETE